jgi:c-di-GMP-binding flagellar brake protein YcgR
MNTDIPLRIEMICSDADSKHSVTSSREITSVLRHIGEIGAKVALYYGEADEFILTTLLGVDSNGIWLEQSPDNAANMRLARSRRLTFVSSLNKVKIQFAMGLPHLVNYQHYPAIFFPLPDSLLRIQRREYFRLMTPVLNPLKCSIPCKQTPLKQEREVIIMDISGGGVALTCAENDTELVPGEIHENCRIDIPEFGTIVATIAVRNLALISKPLGQNFKRAGCEFVNLESSAQTLLQRYVMHLQRV